MCVCVCVLRGEREKRSLLYLSKDMKIIEGYYLKGIEGYDEEENRLSTNPHKRRLRTLRIMAKKLLRTLRIMARANLHALTEFKEW